MARNFFAAATIAAVGAPGVEVIWAKLFDKTLRWYDQNSAIWNAEQLAHAAALSATHGNTLDVRRSVARSDGPSVRDPCAASFKSSERIKIPLGEHGLR